MQKLDAIFEALAHQHRRDIVYVLGHTPHSISQLAEMQKLSLPAIHKHITVLENASLIKRKKIGRTNVLTLNKETLKILQDWLNHYHTYWGTSQETLINYEAYVRNGKEVKKK